MSLPCPDCLYPPCGISGVSGMCVFTHTHAELQPARHPHRAADVAGPHARGEAVVDPVGPGERLILVAEPLHGHDGPEDLALDDLVVLLGFATTVGV